MVSPEKSDPLSVAHFQRQKERNGFDRVVTTIHIVSHEEVVRVRDGSTNIKQFHKVSELPVDVSTDQDRCTNSDNIILLCEDCAGLHKKRLTLAQRSLSSASERGLHLNRCSIC